MTKITRNKPRRGPNAADLIQNQIRREREEKEKLRVDLKKGCGDKTCNHTSKRRGPRTKQERKAEERKIGQDQFLLFLKEEKEKEKKETPTTSK